MNVSYIDNSFLLKISGRLEGWKKVGSDVYNFRCVFCGDSDRMKSKQRGYFYKKENKYFYKCHNCSVGTTLGGFIKKIDPLLYKEYKFELYASQQGIVPKKKERPKFESFEHKFKPTPPPKDYSCITELLDDHVAKQYILGRQIPEDKLGLFYYTDDFAKWVGSYTDKYNLVKEDPRIVIPYYDPDGNMMGAQGRALNNDNNLRYITVKFNKNYPKIYGLERWNPKEPTIIVEGPIDSVFLPNALACMGGDLQVLPLPKDRCVLVFDNEPRNTETIKKMHKSLKDGWALFIWPDEYRGIKDINDCVKAGMDIRKSIVDNTYIGIKAALKLNHWKI